MPGLATFGGLAIFGIYKKSLTFDVTFEGSLLWELYGSYQCDPSANLWNNSWHGLKRTCLAILKNVKKNLPSDEKAAILNIIPYLTSVANCRGSRVRSG